MTQYHYSNFLAHIYKVQILQIANSPVNSSDHGIHCNPRNPSYKKITIQIVQIIEISHVPFNSQVLRLHPKELEFLNNGRF